MLSESIQRPVYILDPSTLHRIRVASLSKLRIGRRVDGSGVRPRIVRDHWRLLQAPHPAPSEAVQCLRHAVTGECPHVAGLGLRQKLGHLRGPDGAPAQGAFEAFQPEGRQHQQPRDERDEEP